VGGAAYALGRARHTAARARAMIKCAFELAYMALAPELPVIAPWREWDIGSREEALAYARGTACRWRRSRATSTRATRTSGISPMRAAHWRTPRTPRPSPCSSSRRRPTPGPRSRRTWSWASRVGGRRA
jgi:hypothetical protein